MTARLPVDALEGTLRWTLQALAQPASIQRHLFPRQTAVGDELAIRFQDAWTDFSRQSQRPLTPEQERSLEILRVYVTTLSSHAPTPLVHEPDGGTGDARWDRVRELATQALRTFDWPSVEPVKETAMARARRRR